MNSKLQFRVKDRIREFRAFGNVTNLPREACFVSTEMLISG